MSYTQSREYSPFLNGVVRYDGAFQALQPSFQVSVPSSLSQTTPTSFIFKHHPQPNTISTIMTREKSLLDKKPVPKTNRLFAIIKVGVMSLISALFAILVFKTPFIAALPLYTLSNLAETKVFDHLYEGKSPAAQQLLTKVYHLTTGKQKASKDLTPTDKVTILPIIAAMTTAISELAVVTLSLLLGNVYRRESIKGQVIRFQDFLKNHRALYDKYREKVKTFQNTVDHYSKKINLLPPKVWQRVRLFGQWVTQSIEGFAQFVANSRLFKFLNRYPIIGFCFPVFTGLLSGYLTGVLIQILSKKRKTIVSPK